MNTFKSNPTSAHIYETVVSGDLQDIKEFVKEDILSGTTLADCLLYASVQGDFNMIKYLVEQNLYQTLKDPFIRAAGSGNLETVMYLGEQLAYIPYEQSLRNPYNTGYLELALIKAASQGHLEVIRYLVKNGANIHATQERDLIYGNSPQIEAPLITAASAGHLAAVRFLVQQGADIAAGGNEALHCACKGGHLEVIKYLLDQAANISNQLEGLIDAARHSENFSEIKDYLLCKSLYPFNEYPEV